MGTYTLKSIGKKTDYMTVVREMDDGYIVPTDFISKALFDSCIRTGYLTKIKSPAEAVA